MKLRMWAYIAIGLFILAIAVFLLMNRNEMSQK
jgi:hypothetical protein